VTDKGRFGTSGVNTAPRSVEAFTYPLSLLGVGGLKVNLASTLFRDWFIKGKAEFLSTRDLGHSIFMTFGESAFKSPNGLTDAGLKLRLITLVGVL